MIQYYSAVKKHKVYSHIDGSVNCSIEYSDQIQKEKCHKTFCLWFLASNLQGWVHNQTNKQKNSRNQETKDGQLVSYPS